MFKGKTILAIIPARGGSKGLPRKNIKVLGGKPLMVWTIEEAKRNKFIDRVIVSTDDSEIAQIAKSCGGEVPFMRPVELATDKAGMTEVINDALGRIGKEYDIVILLQPTSPFRSSEDIDNALELLILKDAKAVVAVCEVDHHPYWSNELPPDGSMKDFLKKEAINTQRQDLRDFYRINGAIYLAYVPYLKEHKGFFGDGTFAYIMPRERSVDIDNENDFQFAEFLMTERPK